MNNEQIKKEYRKAIPFTTVSKKINYLGITLTKEAKEIKKD
jgi:hypothetical protein